MEIRKAKPQDIEQLTKFGLVLLKQHSELDPYFTPTDTADKLYRKFLESCLYSEDGIVLVAENNEELVGYAVGEIKTRSAIFMITDYGYINDVFVDKEFRKILSKEIIYNIISLIPDEWLGNEPGFKSVSEHRQAYIQYLETRLNNSEIFVKEAKHARESII